MVFNWRIIALQSCVGFCCTAKWTSHLHAHNPPLSLPPSPRRLPAISPLIGHPGSPSWDPCAIYTSYSTHSVQISSVTQSCPILWTPWTTSHQTYCIYVNATLSHPLLPLLCPKVHYLPLHLHSYTAFLDSIHMCSYTIFAFLFLTHFTLTGSTEFYDYSHTHKSSCVSTTTPHNIN